MRFQWKYNYIWVQLSSSSQFYVRPKEESFIIWPGWGARISLLYLLSLSFFQFFSHFFTLDVFSILLLTTPQSQPWDFFRGNDAEAETPLATSCEELTHCKRLWCWEGLGAGGEGDDRGWDGWMASLTRWTWVWMNSGSWWWTGRPGVLWFMASQRIGHDWMTELNWTESLLNIISGILEDNLFYVFLETF